MVREPPLATTALFGRPQRILTLDYEPEVLAHSTHQLQGDVHRKCTNPNLLKTDICGPCFLVAALYTWRESLTQNTHRR